MKIHKFDQYSNEWYEARMGLATASEFSRIITARKCEFAAGARSYAIELIAETLAPGICRWASKDYESLAMKRGTLSEPEARRWFPVETGFDVEQVGFITSDCGRFGASPDGLVPEDRSGLELKCPLPKTHVGYLLDGTLPDEYKAQCHGGMIVSKLDAWWFQSYCSGFPSLLLRIERDEYTETLERILNEQFWPLYQELLAKIQAGREELVIASTPVIDPENHDSIW